jgi:hypothetical protein
MASPQSNPEIRERLLPAATVRIYVGGERTGSGFFAGTGTVVTCTHVLKPLDLLDESAVGMIAVRGLNHEEYTVKAIRHHSPEDIDDLAVLRVEPGGDPCVLLDVGLNAGDDVHAFGYTALHDEGIPVTGENEGLSGDSRRFKLKAGRVEHGMSGAPVLNVRTGAVCGVLKRTIDPDQALGGYAIPIASLFDLSDAIASGNRAFHTDQRDWLRLLPEMVRQMWLAGRFPDQHAAPAELVVIVNVTQRSDWWEVTGELHPPGRGLGTERVDLNTVRLEVARLFRDWASPDSTWRGRVNRGEEMRLLGKVLSSAVLPGKIKSQIEQLLSDKPKGWVQVALRFTAGADPDLEYLPWEHLYIPPDADRGESYLAREKRFAFTRMRGTNPPKEETPTTQELTVLVVSARPPGESEAERAMAAAVKSVVHEAEVVLNGLDRVTLEQAQPNSPSGLATVVRSSRPTVIHYVGYGRFQAGVDEIALGESGGQPNYIDAPTFAALLADATPRVVILQLCDSHPAMGGVRADLAPFAPEVLGHGIDALVAYQYPSTSDFIECFNECFYKKLVVGTPVELAVQEGRIALYLAKPNSRAFLAPTVAVRRLGGLRLTSERFESSPHAYVGAAAGYG